MSRVVVSVFVVFVAFAHTCVGQGSPMCEVNSTPKPCGKKCEPTCEKPEEIFCHPADGEHCPNECRCNRGYVRHNGTCIDAKNCPHRCPAHETFSICGRLCEPSCTNENPRCPRIVCTPRNQGCRCIKGYLRDPSTNKCVLRKDCVRCGVNEELGVCGRRCELTCKDQDPGKCAAVSCTGTACKCKEGFFRNENTDVCGPVDQCPKCGYGEIRAACGRTCEGTCKNPFQPEICSRIRCWNVECRCDLSRGYVRDEKTGRCVRKNNCPPHSSEEDCDDDDDDDDDDAE